MIRPALWKLALIVVALGAGFLYALPNAYPVVPAVQVAPSRSGGKADDALRAQVEAVLRDAGFAPAGVVLDTTGITARLADPSAQIRARQLLQAKLGESHVVALARVSTSPPWLAAIGALPMYLGLDLRGGVHFLLQVDVKAPVAGALDRYAADIRTLLRERKLAHLGIAREGANIVVRFADGAARNRARIEIAGAFAALDLREPAAVADEARLVAALSPSAVRRIEDGAVAQNVQILRNRVNELGVAEPIVQQQGPDRVAVQLPGAQDTARAKEILGRTAALEIRMVDETPGALERAIAGSPPLGSDLLTERGGGPVLVRRGVALAAERVTDVQAGFDPATNEPIVTINLDAAGARLFRDLSRDNVGKRMAIVLVERGKAEVITAPVIRVEIGGGRIQINGRMTARQANDISLLMRAGALAAPMEIVEERTIGPSLGSENIARGVASVTYGFIALVVFMCAYYGLLGFVSAFALVVNLLLLLALLSLLQATLTLPGIAAIALTLGMAIDANVLINERVREELRWGAAPHAALQAGYDRAWGTILDSNVTTLIAGIALLIFGSGPVRGFAVVHCLGILTSMFSAVFVSRGIVELIHGSRTRPNRIAIAQSGLPEAGARPAWLDIASRALTAGGLLLAVVALGDLAIRAAIRLELHWDTFAYHLPFAALRGGLPIPYEMNEQQMLRYQGFPALPHLLQGLLWRLTGSVNATGIVGFLAFVAFLAYCHFALRARFWLVALIALTAPLVLIHATASYVDLFGNSLLAIGLASCLCMYLFPERASRSILLCGLAGLAGAAWSKYQLVPVVALGFVLTGVVALQRSREPGLRGVRVIPLLLLGAAVAALPYLGNLVVHGNPFWPVRVPVLADLFPYAENAVADGVVSQRPPPLRDYGSARLFLHSLFEIGHPTHYADRARWIIDQGNAWIAYRMGGFWNIGAAVFLAAMGAMLVVVRRRAGVVAGLAAAATLCFVAVLPQSHELRYYLFIPLFWAAAIGMLFPDFQRAMPRTAIAFLAVVLGLFGYMAWENRVHYEIERKGYVEAASEFGAPQWWAKLQRGQVYCAVDMMPVGMLLTGPTMSEFVIVDRSSESRCPADSIVLTADGRLHRKGDPQSDASRARNYVDQSLAAYRAGNYDAAIAATTFALALQPDSADAYNNRCAAYNSMKRWDEALEACAMALKIRPDYALARNNLAWALQRRQEEAATGKAN